jgi:hypothetical protein
VKFQTSSMKYISEWLQGSGNWSQRAGARGGAGNGAALISCKEVGWRCEREVLLGAEQLALWILRASKKSNLG